MENKKTTELLDLLDKLNKEIKSDSDEEIDWDEYEEICEELRLRFPFSEILGEKDCQNEFTLEERIDALEEDVKLLKRHKHDERSGDVMVRI
jgi:tRNA G10  N-methylase Trm11